MIWISTLSARRRIPIFSAIRTRDGVEGLTTSTDHALDDYDTYEIWSVTGKVSIDFDFATLVAVLNYSDQDKDTSLDVDAGAGPAVDRDRRFNH